MSFYLNHKGNFDNLENWLYKMAKGDIYSELAKYGQEGVQALSMVTPVDTGMTAISWYYTIDHSRGNTSITWYNTNVNFGVNIAIILQYGHGTGTGGYVAGRDYINPAIQPIMDRIARQVWEGVKNSANMGSDLLSARWLGSDG